MQPHDPVPRRRRYVGALRRAGCSSLAMVLFFFAPTAGCSNAGGGGGGSTDRNGETPINEDDDDAHDGAGDEGVPDPPADDGALDPDARPVTDGDWYRPTVDATWQWQLQPDAEGAINTSYDVEMYDIDLFDVGKDLMAALQADGRRVICYFSAGTFEDFREDAGAFAEADLGTTLDDFADERWLDIRSADVQAIMLARLDLAAEKGCDGVEPDNVAGFLNDTGFALTATDQLAFNRFIANEAHRRGLAVGLKNDLEQIGPLLDYFDYAVNEQCHEFDECAAYDAFVEAGKAVFSAEYADVFVEDADRRNAMCAEASARGLRTLVLPVDLDDAFRFSCD